VKLNPGHSAAEWIARHRLTSSGETNTLAEELERLTIAKFDARKEVGYFLPLTLHADLLASLRQSPAPVSEDVKELLKWLGAMSVPYIGGDARTQAVADRFKTVADTLRNNTAELTRTAALLKDMAHDLSKYPCTTNGAEDMEPGCCGPCRARQFLDNLDKGGSQ
jgi:hypothetical protein